MCTNIDNEALIHPGKLITRSLKNNSRFKEEKKIDRQQNNEEREKNQVYNEYKNETLCVCMISLFNVGA